MLSLMGVVGINEVDAGEALLLRDPLLGHDFNNVEGIKGCQMAGRSICNEKREGLERP